MSLKLNNSLLLLPGIGVVHQQNFTNIGINTIEDLLYYFPRKYIDYSNLTNLTKLRPGTVCLKVRITKVSSHRVRRNLLITEGIATDSSGLSLKVVWFNQPYRERSITMNKEFYLSGQYKLSNSRFSIVNPTIEEVSELATSSARIVPIYHETKHINSWLLRKSLLTCLNELDDFPEILPQYIIEHAKLVPLKTAIKQIHFPDSMTELENAQLRFRFNELFFLLLANAISKLDRNQQQSLAVPFNIDLAKQFVKKLPFELTDDQRRVVWQIYQDIQQNKPMNRLVEGDVGSGKTVVALMAAIMAIIAGFKVAFMAPTELLAKQHSHTIKQLLDPLALSESMIFLSGGLTNKQKQHAINQTKLIPNCLIIGTHSLLTAKVDWSNLALLIIDEQHRFGVDQRIMIQQQVGHSPHFLSITATPIPRSLALTLLSDLDLSRLTTMPKLRQPIKTELIPPSSMKQYLNKVKEQLLKKHQIYVVCPFINSEINSRISLETIFAFYKKTFNDYQVAYIHGQMKENEQSEIMNNFKQNKIQILIATSVIEVGVDVSNATVMTIYGPERFGLAQLHQLRGRVGRGTAESYCFVMLEDSGEPNYRLRQFSYIHDGFKLSELDLSQRGAGAIYGKLQHGKGFNLLTLDDHQLIKKVNTSIDLFISNGVEQLINYQVLQNKVKQAQQLTNLN